MYFETDNIMPNEIHVNIKLVPPILIIGKVKPVTGTRWTETAILAKACTTKLRLMPMLKKVPNAFGLLVTKVTERKNSNTNKDRTKPPPNKPHSSQMIA